MVTENPAKAFLRRYRAALKRMDSLTRAINEARNRTTNITMHIKENPVQNGNAAYDSMAEDVSKIIDAENQLFEQWLSAGRILQEVMAAINSVPDEMQKTVLTMRYVEGLGWFKISENIGYEISNTYKLHGRALVHVNRYLRSKSMERVYENVVVKNL